MKSRGLLSPTMSRVRWKGEEYLFKNLTVEVTIHNDSRKLPPRFSITLACLNASTKPADQYCMTTTVQETKRLFNLKWLTLSGVG